MNDFQVIDGSSLHRYRTEIPNIIYELDLSLEEIGFYSFLKKVAGDGGACFMTIRNLASKLRCSENTIRKYKNNLSQPFEFLAGRPLIKIEKRAKPNGDYETDLVTIVDIWPINFAFLAGGGSKFEGGVVQNLKGGGSKFEVKEEPFKKNHIKETPPPYPPHETFPPIPLCENGGGGEVLRYKNLKGKELSIPFEAIFKALPHIPRAHVLHAIHEARESNTAISSPIAYIRGICGRAVEEKKPKDQGIPPEVQLKSARDKALVLYQKIKGKVLKFGDKYVEACPSDTSMHLKWRKTNQESDVPFHHEYVAFRDFEKRCRELKLV